MKNSVCRNCKCTSAKANIGGKKVTSSTFKELADIIVVRIAYVVLTDKVIISQVFVDDLAK